MAAVSSFLIGGALLAGVGSQAIQYNNEKKAQKKAAAAAKKQANAAAAAAALQNTRTSAGAKVKLGTDQSDSTGKTTAASVGTSKSALGNSIGGLGAGSQLL